MATLEGFTKGRSPRYPRISLEAAIGYARRLYDEAHRASVDADTAARLMGFRGRSGASQIALGAVRQFGLVDGLRGAIKISDLAMRILQPGSADEEEEARHEAAFSPEVYDAVVAQFDGELPRSDEPIKAFLIRSMGFSKSGAEDCIGTLRKTLSELEGYRSHLRQGEAPPQLVAPSKETAAQSSEIKHPAAQTGQAATTPVEHYELVRIPLTRDCTAELRLGGKVTSAAIDRLVQYIELMRGVWAEEE
jgi:hypothetical protein